MKDSNKQKDMANRKHGPKKLDTVSPKNKTKRVIQIPKNQFDKQAKEYLVNILSGDEDSKRAGIKIPWLVWVDIRSFLTLKRQTFLEYALALLLEDMDKHERAGLFIRLENRR